MGYTVPLWHVYCSSYGVTLSLDRMAEILASVGVTSDKIISAKDVARRISVRRGRACPACASRPQNFDYVCGACSDRKSKTPRRFWQDVREREDGYEGRPRKKEDLPQSLPQTSSSAKPPILMALPEEIPVAPEDRYEWWVEFPLRQATYVIVSRWGFEAVKLAKKVAGLEETEEARWKQFGETDAPASTIKDFIFQGE